jgi:hypothetical protein
MYVITLIISILVPALNLVHWFQLKFCVLCSGFIDFGKSVLHGHKRKVSHIWLILCLYILTHACGAYFVWCIYRACVASVVRRQRLGLSTGPDRGKYPKFRLKRN